MRLHQRATETGFTLLELVGVSAISGVVFLALIVISMSSSSAFHTISGLGVLSAEQANLVTLLPQDFEAATAKVVACPCGDGGALIFEDTVDDANGVRLILVAPSIDAQGVPLAATDYFLYERQGTTLTRRIVPGGGVRQQETRVLSPHAAGFVFSLNGDELTVTANLVLNYADSQSRTSQVIRGVLRSTL